MTKAVDKLKFKENKKYIKDALPEKSPCPYCNSIMVKDSLCKFSHVSIDHKISHSKGGSDEMDNLMACCANCNNRKGDETRMTIFWLKEPVLLKEKDYVSLNNYITTTNRVFILSEINKLLNENSLEKAIDFVTKSQKISVNKPFLKNLKNILYVFLNDKRELSIKIQKVQALIVKTLKKELDRMSSLSYLVKKYNFNIYSLIA